ncbi:Schizosaccharomyces specific protein Meu43 [Schizosaccharomyces osmophilus]|uniref:Schizosaccharomyces specific protein Meu43 n=1 Tax=Schizosaccharomyces osmophilus TaxID=2545709 RepID=A0AAE9WBG9_9SCHI|nr:Schizosaccharomyces specific protein Meu43 [Schizosaccharomyces osmophilus]WBW73226.1 Schizosaccharomyces specific protein Meu43 [Schizosaccharomyces osmophilus]
MIREATHVNVKLEHEGHLRGLLRRRNSMKRPMIQLKCDPGTLKQKPVEEYTTQTVKQMRSELNNMLRTITDAITQQLTLNRQVHLDGVNQLQKTLLSVLRPFEQIDLLQLNMIAVNYSLINIYSSCEDMYSFLMVYYSTITLYERVEIFLRKGLELVDQLYDLLYFQTTLQFTMARVPLSSNGLHNLNLLVSTLQKQAISLSSTATALIPLQEELEQVNYYHKCWQRAHTVLTIFAEPHRLPKNVRSEIASWFQNMPNCYPKQLILLRLCL